jgi:hypothetical protein
MSFLDFHTRRLSRGWKLRHLEMSGEQASCRVIPVGFSGSARGRGKRSVQVESSLRFILHCRISHLATSYPNVGKDRGVASMTKRPVVKAFLWRWPAERISCEPHYVGALFAH